MKKFNLKKSAKYIICTLLTLTVVATVVFLPRFYYSVTDNRDSVGNTAETFKLTADITTSSGGEFLKLVSNEDTVWVLQNNAPKAETVISYAKKSDLKDWLTSDEVLKLIKAQGYQTKSDVQKLIEEATKNQLTADDVKKIFETMIASDETMGKLQAEMQKIIQQALVDGKYVTEQQMKDFVEGKGYITGADQLSATQINQILTCSNKITESLWSPLT